MSNPPQAPLVLPGPAPVAKRHPFRMDYKRAFIPLDDRRVGHWDNPQHEAELMRWLHAMLHAPHHRAHGPFGPRDSGYRWQLDSSNDWWSEIAAPGDHRVGDYTGPVLILACRYEYQPLAQLAAWVAARVGKQD